MKHDPARGEWREEDARYLLIRNDSLMGLFKHLDERASTAVMEAFRASVMEHGGRMAARQAQANREARLAFIANKAAELGWGVWEFALEEDALRLTVANSPFAAGHGAARAPVCVPICGVLEAVAGLALGATALAEELKCVACGAPICEFRAWRRR